MNIWQLKEYIKDLPDDMEIGRRDDDNTCDRIVEEITVEESGIYTIWLWEWKKYLSFN